MEYDDENAEEFFRERTAIMHIDGGLVMHEAEFFAAVATRRYCRRQGLDEPRDPRYRMITQYMTGKEPLAPGQPGEYPRAPSW
jgi:hypothetical protein